MLIGDAFFVAKTKFYWRKGNSMSNNTAISAIYEMQIAFNNNLAYFISGMLIGNAEGSLVKAHRAYRNMKKFYNEKLYLCMNCGKTGSSEDSYANKKGRIPAF